jgi:hypothetical protein
MKLFAAFGDATLDDRGFTDNEFVQVIYVLCPRCWILSAHQQCD